MNANVQAMAIEQGLLSFQLLQYHILMPSLLISKRASECPDCPSRLEALRAAKLSNQLAINHLTHMVIGFLPTPKVPVETETPVPVDTETPVPDETETPVPVETETPVPVETETPVTVEPETTVTVEPETTVPVEIENPGHLPYLISIQLTNFQDSFTHLCRGIIIGATWILTAAHCLNSERASGLAVIAGETDIRRLSVNRKIIRVEELFKHPSYIYYIQPYEHDVGLIRLAEPIIENKFVKIASLPKASSDILGAECFEVGWGALTENETGTLSLKVFTIPVLPKEQCSTPYLISLGENRICAGQDGVGACVGDNGGPLVCNSMPVAVMSWREGCAQPGKPAIYMDIAKYLPWIREVTGLEL